MRALVVLCAAGAGALQYEAAALRRALGAAKPLQDGTVIFRREWREKAGDDAAADAVYDALTRGRGPEVVAAADDLGIATGAGDRRSANTTATRLTDEVRAGVRMHSKRARRAPCRARAACKCM